MTNLDNNNQLLIIHRVSYSPPAYVHVYLGWQTGVHGACDLGILGVWKKMEGCFLSFCSLTLYSFYQFFESLILMWGVTKRFWGKKWANVLACREVKSSLLQPLPFLALGTTTTTFLCWALTGPLCEMVKLKACKKTNPLPPSFAFWAGMAPGRVGWEKRWRKQPWAWLHQPSNCSPGQQHGNPSGAGHR